MAGFKDGSGGPWPGIGRGVNWIKASLCALSMIVGGIPLPSFAGQAQQPAMRASWIWYPEAAGLDAVNQTRQFRKTFNLDGAVAKAKLWITADDAYTFAVNGGACDKGAPEPQDAQWRNIVSYDIAKHLKAGRNVITVEVRNTGGPAGLLCRAEIVMADGATLDLFTDQSWRASKKAEEGWLDDACDDQSWAAVKVIGDAASLPWGAFIEYKAFMTPRELAAYGESQRELDGKLEAIEKDLLKEDKPTARVSYVKGKPFIDVGGKRFSPLIYKSDDEAVSLDDYRCRKEFEGFKNADVHLFGMDINLGSSKVRPAAGKLNIDDFEKQLLRILAIDPEAYFLVGIRMNAPEWWLKANPDQLIRYASGRTSATDGICAVAASYASRPWRDESGELIKQIIKRFESKAVGRRIFAYRMDYGVYREWHYFGMTRDMPDTGEAMTAAFRAWLKNKYAGDLKAFRKAWNDQHVSFDDASVPGKEERGHMGMLALRDPVADRKVLDYLQCHQEVVRDCLLYFNGIAKAETNGRTLVGNYFGYFFGMYFPAEGGHLATEDVLNSPLTDFTAAPHCYTQPTYQMRAIGESGPPRVVTEAYRLRGKLHIIEADTRTHLVEQPGKPASLEESITLLTRDFCNALTRACGIWYYDFGGNWYDDPVIYKTMKQMQAVNKLDADCSSVSEVAIICDFESVKYHTYSVMYCTLNDSLLYSVISEVPHCGAPYDTVLVSDLGRKNIKDYKVYIFPNMLYVTPEKRALIDDLKKRGKTLVWLYAPGFITPEGMSCQSASELTGIKIKCLPERASLVTSLIPGQGGLTAGLACDSMPSNKMLQISEGPVFYVDDKDALLCGELKHGKESLPSLAMKQVDGFTSVYCSTPFLGRDVLRNIYKMAGVHVYSQDSGDVIYANKSFVALHSKSGGRKTISLPGRAASVQEVMPEEKDAGNNTSEIELDVRPASTTLLYLKAR